MAESIDAVLAYWSEQREQMRQCETQRSVLTNYVLVLVTAATGLIVQQKFQVRTLPLALLLSALGLYGALACAKYHERAQYHLGQARALTEVLVRLGALPPDTELAQKRQEHYAAYGRLAPLRLHGLWTGLHLAIACYGLMLVAAMLAVAARA
jgi:type IV secretory pathway TrbF-like protein